ncbi:hypothetical protein EG359_22510 (plasmid) [Chryseobacterium joostei]|uniref:DUF4133 domain-containing protein n=1 Tax=Chryseobacterium joostei TaxID=112234 RepID=A0A1N7KG71_9FLAO|nr:hypothetical protein [Chryseobacterium joostei]AZB02434.1 hypothetical protein EG359_22510 [Chryseobacterium joostei]SIS60573.1 hypothetical protein SAMN05421768_11213 [Chryseobacterium joostei]
MKNYRVNKGLQKEIRFIGLNQNYAMQFFGVVTLSWLLLFSAIGVTMLTLLLYMVPIVGFYPYFKKMDKKNQKNNIKKTKANGSKPIQYKREFTPITENNEELLTK